MTSPTPYPDVNAVVEELLGGLGTILGSHLLAFYLGGSLAAGDFNPETSDVDFIAVPDAEIRGDRLAQVAALHARLGMGATKWGYELEGSYIPPKALRRYDPRNATHPHIERGGALHVEPHLTDSIIQRYVVREHGVVLLGPPRASLIDPISPADLRRAVVDLLVSWWAPMLDHPSIHLEHRGYRAYAILTMARILYTLERGTILSKPAAGRWLRDAKPRWRALVDWALTSPYDASVDNLAETLELIRVTAERGRLDAENG